jgi:glycosyltransferase involved in cell wall biosynthesis
MDMKPTLTISANAAPPKGGQGLNLQQMIEGLREEFTIDAYCRGGAAPVPLHHVPPSRASTLIQRMPLVRRLRDFTAYLSDTQFDKYVASHLKKVNLFQGVVGHCHNTLARARKLGIPTVLDSVTAHIDDLGGQMDAQCAIFGIRPPLGRLVRQRMRSEYTRADFIRVMSRVAQKTFTERGFPAERLIVAHPPMGAEAFPQAAFNQSEFRITFVGLLEPWKGFHHLIEAFEGLGIPDASLYLWGGPGSRSINNYMKAKLQNPAIHMRPVEVRKAGLDEVYGKASVLVHPSLSDGFGFVVAEAMSCGLPAITTPATGASDLITDGVNGYVVPPGDIIAIRERLRQLAANPSQLREMGRQARQAISGLTIERFRADYAKRLMTLVR